MRNILFYLSLLILFSSINSLAQISPDEYYAQKDSLIKKKNELTFEIKLLKTEIDSLKKIIPFTDQEIKTCYRELYTLKYGKEIGERVTLKKIWKGMTDKMVKDGWGEPDFIEKNVEKWGVFTQWHYGDIIFFFRDGKLTDWEEGKTE